MCPRLIKRIWILISFCFCGIVAHAQFTVNPSLTPYQMASIIAGPGVSILNASYSGIPVASGSFTSTGTILGLNSGIILTSGDAINSIGPNNIDSASTEFNSPGDLDLESLTGVQTFDAAILEFDFIPQSDTLTFRYVFASEEYPEFVCSQYNDLFGFFISGPGIIGNPNLALIPGTSSPVAINTVNSGALGTSIGGAPSADCGLTNSVYYIDNTGGLDIQYDGLTVVLTAQKIVTRCLTYHLKISIADGADSYYDSGVFIEAGSLSSTPIVNAGPDLTACVNLNSFIGTLAIVGWSYSWSPSTGLNNNAISNPSITLTNATSSPMVYNYVVTADNGTSCILHDTVVVTVNPIPTSPFLISAPSSCQSDTVTISYVGNAQTGIYNWNFGGGTVISGTGIGPYLVVYPNPGDFTISLSVTLGTCQSLVSNKVIHIKTKPSSAFSIPTAICATDLFNANYTGNYISSTTNYNWYFGSSTILSGTGKGPFQIKAIGNGIQNYALIVSDSGCSTTTIQPINITPYPIARISNIPDFCTGDTVSINYLGSTTINDIYNWTFGNGVVLSGTGVGPYEVSWANQISDSVKVIVNVNGCRDTASSLFHSYKQPLASITFNPNICELSPLTINFNGIADLGSTFNWNMNNPLQQQGSGIGPIITSWNSPGKKALSLSINNHGCVSSTTDTITILPKPNASILSASTLCSNDTLSIISNSTAGISATFYWNFNNGQIISGYDAGPFNIKWNSQITDTTQLIVSDNGCRDTALKIINIYQQPIAAITSPPSLCEKQEGIISFSGSAVLGSTFNWTLNNPTTQIGSGPILASWNSAGTKNIKLTVNNNGCIDTTSANILINPKPVAKFIANNICDGIPLTFLDSSSINGSTLSTNKWDFGDSQTANNIFNPIHLYSKDSTYLVKLIVESVEGCKDTVSKAITVYENPVSNFTSDTICQGLNTNFIDLSKISSSTITNWKWTFGDNNSSSTKIPTHIYLSGGSFTTSLVVTSQQGCKDSTSFPVRVWTLPIASFTPHYVAGCEPFIVNFKSASSSVDGTINNIEWKFGDGSIDSLDDPKHTYVTQGLYTVSLLVSSTVGCIDDTTINSCVKIFPKPAASFYYMPIDPDMLSSKIFFVNTSTDNSVNRWLFSDGNNSSIESPEHTYKNAGTYPVTLYVTSDDGCKDTTEQIITVKNSFTIYIPNAFTPNNDIVNDYFLVKGYGIINYEINIFDRWGKLIFTSHSITDSWDGTLNRKEAPEDTYLYKIKVKDFSLKDHDYAGRVSIIR